MKRESKSKQKISYVSLCMILCSLFFITFGCEKSNDSNENDNDDLTWSVRLKLKPQSDESYLATEDPVIKALLLKYGVAFKQSFPGAKNLELLLDYDLTGPGTMSEESRGHCIADFLATEKFEDEVYEYGIAHTG